MIDIHCSCGARFQVLNEQVAERVRCLKCGARASDLLRASKEEEMAASAPAEPGEAEAAEPQVRVCCVNHDEEPATQNCMNCGKPLCMECVRQNGYYCSTACKEAVQTSEPAAMTGNEQEMAAVDKKVEQIIQPLGYVLRKLVLPTIVAIVAAIGFLIYRGLTAPRGKLTTSIPLLAQVAGFNAKMIEPDSVLVQANNELSLLKLSTQQKLWTVNLGSLEEKHVPPKRPNAPADDEPVVDFSRYRDALQFADVRNGNVILHSQRQLIDIDLKDGNVKWKFFDPGIFLASVSVHDGGVWCSIGGGYFSGNARQSQFVNFSLTDGTQMWSYTNADGMVTQSICTPEHTALLIAEPSAKPARVVSEEDEAAEQMAAVAKQFSAQNLVGQGKGGRVAAKRTNYTLRFLSPTDGQVLGQQTMALAGYPRFERWGKYLCLAAGEELIVFGNGIEPLWKSTLPVVSEVIAGGGDLIAAKTSDGLVAFDAQSGQTKWTRTGLAVEQIAVAPDGSVYATVALSKDKEDEGEAAKFRNADVSRAGSRIPGEPITTLLKLDPKNGKTRWGAKNIGRHLLFSGSELYVIDQIERMNLLANQIMVHNFSVHALSPRDGKDLWSYLAEADLYHQQAAGKTVFLVTAADPPFGRQNPSCNYQLQIVKGK